jgi:heat shock protein 90kDa beta
LQIQTETVEEPVEESAEDKKKKEDEKAAEEEDKPKEDEADEKKKEEEKEAEEKPKTKTVEKTVWDWQRVNSMKPIWMRKSADVTEEEYTEFYKSITKDYDEPLVRAKNMMII